MQTFLQLAKEADVLLQAEKDKLTQLESRLGEKASSLAVQEDTANKQLAVLAQREKEIQSQDEELTRKMMLIRRDEESQKDLKEAAELRKAAQDDFKKASEERAESARLLAELYKREVALSEREKSYRQEIELQVMRNVSGLGR